MPHKDPIAKRLYMREYLRKRREDPEFRRIANQRTMQSRKKPEGARKHAEANAQYKQRFPERARETMQRVDASPHRAATRKDRQKQWLANIDITTLRALQQGWRRTRGLRLAQNGGTCTLDQWRDRWLLYGQQCAYCHTPLLFERAEIDHVIPVSKGGAGWPSNIVPACRHCNARKHAKVWAPRLPAVKES